MSWQPIETATLADAPFTVWISPWGDPVLQASTVRGGCTFDATGAVVDGRGEPVVNATHWRAQ